MARLSLQSTASLRAQLLPSPLRSYRHPSQPSKRSLGLKTENFQGARCLITGGSRGIGKAIALHFARSGASCHIIGRKEEQLVRVVAELDQANDTDSTAGDTDPSASNRWSEKSTHGYVVGDVGLKSFWEGVSKRYAVSNIRSYIGVHVHDHRASTTKASMC